MVFNNQSRCYGLGYGASDTPWTEVGVGERLVNKGWVQLDQLRGYLKSKPQRRQ